MNKLIVSGRPTRDPEIFYSGEGEKQKTPGPRPGPQSGTGTLHRHYVIPGSNVTLPQHGIGCVVRRRIFSLREKHNRDKPQLCHFFSSPSLD